MKIRRMLFVVVLLALLLSQAGGAYAEAGTIFPWREHVLDTALVVINPEEMADIRNDGVSFLIEVKSLSGDIDVSEYLEHQEDFKFLDADGTEYEVFDPGQPESQDDRITSFGLAFFLEGKTEKALDGAKLVVLTDNPKEKILVDLNKVPRRTEPEDAGAEADGPFAELAGDWACKYPTNPPSDLALTIGADGTGRYRYENSSGEAEEYEVELSAPENSFEVIHAANEEPNALREGGTYDYKDGALTLMVAVAIDQGGFSGTFNYMIHCERAEKDTESETPVSDGAEVFTVSEVHIRPITLISEDEDGRVEITESDFSREMELIDGVLVGDENDKAKLQLHSDGGKIVMVAPDGIEITVSFEGKTYHGVIQPGTAIKSETVDGKVYLLFDPAVFK